MNTFPTLRLTGTSVLGSDGSSMIEEGGSEASNDDSAAFCWGEMSCFSTDDGWLCPVGLASGSFGFPFEAMAGVRPATIESHSGVIMASSIGFTGGDGICFIGLDSERTGLCEIWGEATAAMPMVFSIGEPLSILIIRRCCACYARNPG